MKELVIGNVVLENPYILAPMAGVCDLPFRVICSQMGAGMVCMEMVSAKAVSFNNKKTADLLKTDPKESRVSLQLFGSEAKVMADVAARVEDGGFDIIDINMGCPVPKIVGNGDGSALMTDPHKAHEIVKAVAGAVEKPVTVKFRKGFDDEHVNAVEFAKYMEDAGAKAVAVHGRTRQQYYSGKADWEIIADVKRAVSIPVIGNGDVTDPESAHRLMNLTGCDGVMIGRAARGNPWLFRDFLQYDDTGEYEGKPDVSGIAKMILDHAKSVVEYKGEYIGIRQMRKHAGWYVAGCYNSARLREEVNRAQNYDELCRIVEDWVKEWEKTLDKD